MVIFTRGWLPEECSAWTIFSLLFLMPPEFFLQTVFFLNFLHLFAKKTELPYKLTCISCSVCSTTDLVIFTEKSNTHVCLCRKKEIIFLQHLKSHEFFEKCFEEKSSFAGPPLAFWANSSSASKGSEFSFTMHTRRFLIIFLYSWGLVLYSKQFSVFLKNAFMYF